MQASLFFSLKRAENIANLALWPGSNLTWAHPLDSMGPEGLFPEMGPEYLGSILHLLLVHNFIKCSLQAATAAVGKDFGSKFNK